MYGLEDKSYEGFDKWAAVESEAMPEREKEGESTKAMSSKEGSETG